MAELKVKFIKIHNFNKGSSIKDVSTKRGRGSAKCGRYCLFFPVKGQNMRTWRPELKNDQILRTSFMDFLHKLCILIKERKGKPTKLCY